MRTSTTGLLATLIVASTFTIGGCQQKPNQAQAKAAQVSQSTQNKALAKQDNTIPPDGWLVTDNQIFIPIVDRLGKKLSLAREAYLKGNNNAAAIAMREGSAFLVQEMPNTSKEAQANLKQASDELMAKASIVQMGEIDSVKELDRLFVKAYQADVQHRWLFVDESEWIPVVQMPQQHFLTAKQDFRRQDYSTAATHIRKGAEFLKLESNRTRDSDLKLTMLGAASDLEQLADEIKQGKVNDVNQLERSFAHAQLAMGEFLSSKAQESESRGQLETAAHEAIAAFKQIQTANTWLGKDSSNLKQAQADINLVRNGLGLSNEAQSRNLSQVIATIDEQIATFSPKLSQ